jgi:gamma-glutamyltranspeptidase/glutathione hydrolase
VSLSLSSHVVVVFELQSVGGKRPMSSMSPTLVFRRGRPVLALGSPGGSRIIGTVLNVLLNVLDFNMPLQDAVDAPRVISRNSVSDIEAAILAEYVPLVRW